MTISDQISSIDTSPRHPIRLVANRTGLTVDLIRAWERRYQVVDPARSDTQRRLYSDYDIERLRLIRLAKQGGHRLVNIARMPLDALRDALSEDIHFSSHHDNGGVQRPERPSLLQIDARAQTIDAMLFAIQAMDQHRFDQLLQQGMVRESLPSFLEEILAPLLQELGNATRSGSMRIAHEHMATAHLRTFLGALRYRESFTGIEPKVVITTPTGQFHELGALMAAALVSVDGWLPVYLGPNTPADEIAASAVQCSARAVCLSLTYPADDLRIPTELARLKSQLARNLPLFVGGAAVSAHSALISRLGIKSPASFREFRQELRTLRDGQRETNS
jgi:DNA-binding transcriptional MerR regulator/methylmalonyl-CoA mutase cobalamin-binding subunit|tara:strand:- start:1017 stop:2018 length:1002 start_codon:yes stop_codon:yes gene_type:complete